MVHAAAYVLYCVVSRLLVISGELNQNVLEPVENQKEISHLNSR